MKQLSLAAAISLIAIGGSAVAASDRMEDGRKVYEANCAKCHESGIMGAPVTGIREDWVDRSALWEAVLLEHAEQGYLRMPAKGGNVGASEYDVKAAAEYMLTTSHPDLPKD